MILYQQEERASETLGNIKYPLSLVREALRSLEAKLWWGRRDSNLLFTSQLHASSIAHHPTIRHCHRRKTANLPSHEPNTWKTGRYNGSMSRSDGTWQTQAPKWTLAVKSECDFYQQITTPWVSRKLLLFHKLLQNLLVEHKIALTRKATAKKS